MKLAAGLSSLNAIFGLRFTSKPRGDDNFFIRRENINYVKKQGLSVPRP